MPTIPELIGLSDGTFADPRDVYKGPITGGLYRPDDLDTFEVVNGGLDASNYGGGDGSLSGQLLQAGTWARVVALPWTRFAYYYAKQATGTSQSVQARLALEFFLPWDASVVIIGWQGLFNQDATTFNTGGLRDEEQWELSTFFDDNEMGGLSAGLPVTRATIDVATASPPVNNANYSDEERWRHVARAAMEQDVSQGAHTVQVMLRATISSPDVYSEKVAEASGCIYIIAIR
tara:strand:- start:837 stop:1535 length:699 start_codon:yes stop_codon:yes gene_type:complete